MKKGGGGALWVLFGVIVAIFLLNGGEFGLLSAGVVGEEGFEPYDLLLVGGGLDHTRWSVLGTPRLNPGDPSCTISDGSTNSQRICYASVTAFLADEFSVVTTSPNELTIGGNMWLKDQELVLDEDLRLVDFRANVELYPGGDGSEVCFYGVCHSDTSGSSVRTSREGLFELVWDNYELGQYQLKWNGVVIQEGVVPEGSEFRIRDRISADGNLLNGAGGKAEVLTIKNPRVRSVFGCDLQGGEVAVYDLLEGPGTYDLGDLRGFKRFCPEFSQEQIKDGVRSNRDRVIYSLAGGEPLVVGENEVWVLNYIADASVVGSTSACSLYDLDKRECTGVVLVCDEGENFLDGVGCVSLQNDLVDLPVRSTVVSDSTVMFSTGGKYAGGEYSSRDNDLLSGDLVFLSASDVRIDTNFCPYSVEKQVYPRDGLNKNCFSFDVWGETFVEGSSHDFGSVSLRLERVDVEYKSVSSGRAYSWSADWVLEFDTGGVSFESVVVPSEVRLGSSGGGTAGLRSDLPGSGSFVLLQEYRESSVGGVSVVREEFSLGSGESGVVSLELSDEFLGGVDLVMFPLLVLDGKSVAFDGRELSYSVVNEPVDSTPVVSKPVGSASGGLVWLAVAIIVVWLLIASKK